jgi:hypothetical protein
MSFKQMQIKRQGRWLAEWLLLLQSSTTAITTTNSTSTMIWNDLYFLVAVTSITDKVLIIPSKYMKLPQVQKIKQVARKLASFFHNSTIL